MLLIVRLVEIQHDSVEGKEAFINFIPLDVETPEVVIVKVNSKLGRSEVNLEDCRDQSYNNQATMAGVSLVFKNEF
jgi:hypothetical protein